MKNRFLLIFLLIFLTVSFVFNQETISGKVIGALDKKPVFGAVIYVDSVPKARTSYDGKFSLQLPNGKYDILASCAWGNYSAYKTTISTNQLDSNYITIILPEKFSVKEIESVTVIGRKINASSSTFESVYNKRKNEETFSNAIPKKQLSNTGVSDAAGAVQMVSGATVKGGEQVFIRGLGDRYTKVNFNGIPIPSLNPVNNAVQLDIFPSFLINNITVYKTFSPELNGNFVGGLVNISTLEFPQKETFYAKIGLEYNIPTTFNSDFVTYKGGKLDFLGFDDGTRKIPFSSNQSIPNPAHDNPLTTQLTKSFSNTMAPYNATPFLNHSMAILYGNKLEKELKNSKKLVYGYSVALNYSAKNQLLKEVQFNEFRMDSDHSRNELYLDRGSKGNIGKKDVLWSALLNQSFKINRSKINLTFFHTQNGTSSAAVLTQENTTSNPSTLKNVTLQYTQRSISNLNLNGMHFLGKNNNWKLEWVVSPTYSTIKDPDMRSTILEEIVRPDGSVIYQLNSGVGAEIRRTFRYLNEYNVVGKINISYEFKQWNELESSLSFGAYNSYKNRTYDVNSYVFMTKGGADESGDPDWFFQDENIWTPKKETGTYGIGQKQPANNYIGKQNVSAFYVMNKLPLTSQLTATYGVRMERNINLYTGQANNAAYDPSAPNYNNEPVLKSMRLLPSVNLVYRIKKEKDSIRNFDKQTNFRLAYSNTVARPTFREISISQINDPILGRTFLGNINLKETFIYNLDFRFEHFFGQTELISTSLFYKKFNDPIAIIANFAAPNEFKPINTGEATVLGAEFEIRKQLGFISNENISLTLGANFTYIFSRVNMNKVHTEIGNQTFTEKEIREKYARDGQEIGDYRQMFGQSPFVVNGVVTFHYLPLHLMVNLNYNVQGKRLAVIGVGAIPDVYEMPFHSLNLKISKKLGRKEIKRWNVSIEASNLLNNSRTKLATAFQAENKLFSLINKGRTFSFSVSYRF